MVVVVEIIINIVYGIVVAAVVVVNGEGPTSNTTIGIILFISGRANDNIIREFR